MIPDGLGLSCRCRCLSCHCLCLRWKKRMGVTGVVVATITARRSEVKDEEERAPDGRGGRMSAGRRRSLWI